MDIYYTNKYINKRYYVIISWKKGREAGGVGGDPATQGHGAGAARHAGIPARRDPAAGAGGAAGRLRRDPGAEGNRPGTARHDRVASAGDAAAGAGGSAGCRGRDPATEGHGAGAA